MSGLRSSIRNLLRKKRVEEDLDEEVRSYLEMLVDEKVARGLDEAEARRLARTELGGIDFVKERVREVRMGARFELVWQELRYAVRVLRKSPAFSVVAVTTIALGIGANTAVFSVFNAVLLRPLPYADEKQIVAIREQRLREDLLRGPVSAADFLDWRSLARTFSAMALYDTSRQSITDGGEAELITVARVTAGFFETLQVQPRIGRTFEVAEEDPGHQSAAILTYGTWQRRYGGDAAILDKFVHVNGEPLRIIGVLPEGFRYPFAAACDLFVPIRLTPDDRRIRGIHQFSSLGRLRDGNTIEQARAEMEVISRQLEQANPDSNVGHAANLLLLHEELSGQLQPALLVLLGAVFLVILIACANVANLMLARASVRARETAVRAALGCSRARLILQSFMESAVLAVAGATVGVALAWWGLAAMQSAFFTRLDFFSTAGLTNIEPDWRVLVFTLGCAVLSTVLFGISPALTGAGVHRRVHLNEALRSGGRGSTSGDRQNYRSVLVVVQVALSVILLTGAGLLGKSFLRLMSVNPGFEAGQVVTASISLPGARYRTNEQAAAFYDALLERAGALPGVRAAATTDVLPLSGDDNRSGVRVEGFDPRPGERIRMHPRLVSPGYLETMGIRLVQGRRFTAADATAKHQVAIISEAAAQKYWPNGNPVGKRFGFRMDNAPWIEVVGVAGAVHNLALDRDSTPDVYLPYRENPFLYVLTRVSLVLKSDLSERALASSIRATVASLDPSVAVSDIRPMGLHVTDSVAPQRFNLILLALFAAIALVLAATGLYGVLSYLVSQRSAEIGIRMALGAGKQDVLWMVIGRGFVLACAGVVLGTATSLGATQVMSKLLFGVEPRDPAIFVMLPFFLLVVALVASYIPARRATKVDPLTALRAE